jgi:hypothetical protein
MGTSFLQVRWPLLAGRGSGVEGCSVQVDVGVIVVVEVDRDGDGDVAGRAVY